MSSKTVGFAIRPDPLFVVVALVGGYANDSFYAGGVADGFQQMRCSHNVGSVGSHGSSVRTSNQGLCREMKDDLRREVPDGCLQFGEIQNIAANVVD